MNVIEELDTLIRARYAIIWIESPEETRVIGLCKNIAKNQDKKLYTWSLTQGLIGIDLSQQNAEMGKPIEGTQDPIAAMSKIPELDEKAIIILKDFHRVIEDNMVCRGMRDLSESLKASKKTLIVISPVTQIPIELQKSITVISMPLPNTEDLEIVLNNTINRAEDNAPEKVKEKIKKAKKEMKNGLKDQVLNAAKGLTLDEAENVFSKSLIAKSTIEITTIIGEKEQIIKKSGILEFFGDVRNLLDIGGYENVKMWIQKRKKAFTSKAKDFGLRTPRGIFFTGAPGTGKSLLSKAIAGYFEMPLLRFDVSKIFSGIVGSSEQNMNQALKMAEAVAPCILWIDEVEKAMAGVGSSGQLDSGVTARVFGTLLTWMQEHKEPVFVVVTSNNPLTLPPEFMRRFDEVFFIDLPTEKERADIFKIHLSKLKRDPANFDISKAAICSEGYSGAEIENSLMSAMYDAYDSDTELDDSYIYAAIKRFKPLSEKRKDEIEKMREWGLKNAINASVIEVKTASTGRGLEFA